MSILKHPITYAAVLLLILLFNITHIVDVYLAITDTENVWRAYASLIVLDLAILLCVVRGMRVAAAAFALVISALSLHYFLAHADGVWQQFSGVLFAMVYPGASYLFAELFLSQAAEAGELAALRSTLDAGEEQANALKQRIIKLEKDVANERHLKSDIQRVADSHARELEAMRIRFAEIERIAESRARELAERPQLARIDPPTKPANVRANVRADRTRKSAPFSENQIAELAKKYADAREEIDMIRGFNSRKQMTDKRSHLRRKMRAGNLNGQSKLLEMLEEL